MHQDPTNRWRSLLDADPPAFVNRVNTPWDDVPDLEDYNSQAFKRVERALRELTRPRDGNSLPCSQGILILGEAGTGKTHILMRVARKLSRTNHILFIRKPNNEEAVAQHVWANMIDSLARTVPGSGTERSQLDDLLANVFAKGVLIPALKADVKAGKDPERKQRWVTKLQDDAFNLFQLVTREDTEKRQNEVRLLKNRTLDFLKINQPDVDQMIAGVLIAYCFATKDLRKRCLLSWLKGQEITDEEASQLGLSAAWVKVDDSSSEAAVQQQREEQALRAIRTIAILSTYYQPLIVAFDQLEGLRDQVPLTRAFGDVLREISTMAPNLLIVTCIFPSLWQSWFTGTLDRSATDRIAAQEVTLETFAPRHGVQLMATHLRAHVEKYQLPTNLFPFTEADVASLCAKATSPRSFLQLARSLFSDWLDGDLSVAPEASQSTALAVVDGSAIDAAIERTWMSQQEQQHSAYDHDIPIQEDLFGRVRGILETLIAASGAKMELRRLTYGNRVMPANVLAWAPSEADRVCICVLNAVGNPFTARMRNLNSVIESSREHHETIVLRDLRCGTVGAKGAEHVVSLRKGGGCYLELNALDLNVLNAIYDTLVAIEERDVSVLSHQVTKTEFMNHLRAKEVWSTAQVFRLMAERSGALARAMGITPSADEPAMGRATPEPPPARPATSPGDAPMQILIGDRNPVQEVWGTLGHLDDGRIVAVALAKPQCMGIFGYMGSGKSYALGVLVENALLRVPLLVQQSTPLSVVAFNYRSNPQARFEYAGFGKANAKPRDRELLYRYFGAEPGPTARVQVFGYGPELARRREEYASVDKTYRIAFRPDELRGEHWQILMKPPKGDAEYVALLQDIIQRLYYEQRLTYQTLESCIREDTRFSAAQRKKAMNRMSFVEKWLSDDREYEWSSVLTSGTLSVFDLRVQAMMPSDVLQLCLVITDLVRSAKNGVNKMIIFDEAHEYIDSAPLVKDLENVLTQIRHDGLSFVLASQFPQRIPESILRYLSTRLIFKLPDSKSIATLRKVATNLSGLSADEVSNLDLEQGVCFIQTDDECSDPMLRNPQRLRVRPRCTFHDGDTIRNE